MMEPGPNFLFGKVGSGVIKFHGLFRVLHSVHRGVESSEKSVWPHLTYFSLIVRLQMVRHSLKVWDRAGDSQSGLKYSKEQIL